MKRYVLADTTTYRVPDVAAVEELHEELLASKDFQLVGFSYKTKAIKEKGEIVEEYQVVTAKKVFNDNEKEPETMVEIEYKLDGYGSPAVTEEEELD
jgi:hypothetical protein